MMPIGITALLADSTRDRFPWSFLPYLTSGVPAGKVALTAVTSATTKAHPAKAGAAKPRVLASSATPLSDAT